MDTYFILQPNHNPINLDIQMMFSFIQPTLDSFKGCLGPETPYNDLP